MVTVLERTPNRFPALLISPNLFTLTRMKLETTYQRNFVLVVTEILLSFQEIAYNRKTREPPENVFHFTLLKFTDIVMRIRMGLFYSDVNRAKAHLN